MDTRYLRELAERERGGFVSIEADDLRDLLDALDRAEALRDEAEQLADICHANHEGAIRNLRDTLERAERERDEWKAKHDTLADVSRSCIATAERERDEARAERDARPDISPEDAALHTGAVTFTESVEASHRIHAALRAHAAKVKP